jgi:hypothetical protein
MATVEGDAVVEAIRGGHRAALTPGDEAYDEARALERIVRQAAGGNRPVPDDDRHRLGRGPDPNQWASPGRSSQRPQPAWVVVLRSADHA